MNLFQLLAKLVPSEVPEDVQIAESKPAPVPDQPVDALEVYEDAHADENKH